MVVRSREPPGRHYAPPSIGAGRRVSVVFSGIVTVGALWPACAVQAVARALTMMPSAPG